MDNHHFVTFKNGILSLNPNFSCKDAEYEVFDMGEDDYHNKVIFNQTFNSPTRIESEFVKVSYPSTQSNSSRSVVWLTVSS